MAMCDDIEADGIGRNRAREGYASSISRGQAISSFRSNVPTIRSPVQKKGRK